jgi:Tol biopolymer transport system component
MPRLAFPIYRHLFIILIALQGANAAEPRRLTTDGGIKLTPAFLNGEELVYVDFEKPELTTLKRLRMKDLHIDRFHPKAASQELEPAFSPDGKWCTYLKATGTLSVTLVIRNEQGQQEAFVSPGGGFSGFRSPAFTPDGKRVIYSFAENNYQNLFSVNLEGKDRQQLTQQKGMNYWPSYSPDSERILFGSTRDGNYEIYTMKVDGKDVQRLTKSRFQDLRPRFSPDGKRIAFTSSRDGNFEVYIMNVDGTGLKRMTNHPERDDYPTWHPNGKQLAIVSERDGRHDLYLLTIDTQD